MVDRLLDADRFVFPVGQDVRRDDVDMLAQCRPVTQPEFPDIGVGHRHRRLAPGAREQRGQRLGRQFAAQQDLVADHQQLHHVAILVRQVQRAAQLGFVGRRVAPDPGAEHHAQPEAAGDGRHRVEAVVEAVGTHAAGHRPEQAQVGLDGLRRDVQARVEGRLAGAAEGRVGDAGQHLRPGRTGRLGQGRGAALRYRLRQDQRQRNGEQEQHRAAPGSARALGGGLGIMGRHR
jgi:hypothetical protein